MPKDVASQLQASPSARPGRFRRGILAAFLLLAVAASGLVAHRVGWSNLTHLPTRLVTRWAPPVTEARFDGLRKPERRAFDTLRGALDAWILWSSNRTGNHELYRVDTRSGEVRRLTDHPHVDFASRFSPDGERIVFLRSRREWVSFRDDTEWDVYVMQSDGSGERRVAQRGYHPTWSRDGNSIVFQRGDQVLRLDLETGEEHLLWGAEELLRGQPFGDPELHASGTPLAFGVQGVGAMVVDPASGAYRHLTEHQVCQTTWVPGTSDLLWVDPNGNGGTRIMRGRSDGSAVEVFMDLPGSRSHEYFPTLSDTGDWLVWGATDEGHEHDRANYEIHLWRVGQPWTEVVRLTYYPGNDQWPDIHLLAPQPSE